MSSLTFLTSELQALSKEAGRKHADVKEAADKALALLRSSPDSALSDLHEAEPSTSTPAKYPVLLAPIVYGCSTKNPKVTSIAVSGLQRLTGVRGAITQNTVPVILATLRSVLSQGVEIQLKILQTLVSLLTNCKDVHGDLLAETLLISFKLLESKIGVVSSTAAATLRQLVMFVFENVDEEDRFYRRAKEDPSIPGPIPTDFSVPIPSPSPADPDSKQPHYLLPAARDAYLVFDDICLLINGEQPSFLKLQNLPRTFGLELIESVLSDFSNVFIGHPELLHLLRTLLSPLLIRALAEKPSFSTTLRLMRVMYLLLKKFNDHLIMESEIFLCMFVKIVAPGDTEGSGGHPLSSSMLPILGKEGKPGSASSGNNGNSPPWMRVLALEILRGLCGDFELLSKIWSRYDSAGGVAQPQDNASTTPTTTSAPSTVSPASKVPVFRSMITALNKLATEKPALLGTGTAVISGVVADPQTGEYSVSGVMDGIVGMAQQAATSVGVSGLTHGGLALANASVKIQCIDQLDKTDAPLIPETYVFLLALQCLNAIAEGFAASTLSMYSNIMNKRPRSGQDPLPAPPALDLDHAHNGEDSTYTLLRTSRDMADAAWPALLASLSFYLSTNLDDDLFSYTLSAFQQFSTTCGVLALNTPRDAFLISLCKFAVPPPIISNLAAADTSTSTSSRPPLNSVLSAGADALGLSSNQAQPMSLSTRNLLCLRSLIHVAQALAGSLERTWFYVFEALQNADLVVRTEAARRQKRRTFPQTTGTTPASPSKGVSSSYHHGSSHGNASTASSSTAHTAAGPRFLPTDQEEQAAQTRANRLFEASKALDDDAFWWFVTSLCRLNGEMIGIPLSEFGDSAKWTPGVLSPRKLDSEIGEDGIVSPRQAKRSGINVIRTLRPGEKSYAVTKLGDVSVMNMRRMTVQSASDIAWEVVVEHLLLVQHWQQAPTIVRMQAAETFDKIVSLAPREATDLSIEVQRKVQTNVLDALSKQSLPQSRAQQSTDIDIRQAGLDTLFRLLESQGHTLSCGWLVIFDILRSACPGDTGREINPPPAGSNATTAKASQLVRVAFSSLQLICSDFLAGLSIAETSICITTLTAFGRQVEDVNIALTAGNLLWQVSDHLQAARRQSDVPAEFLKLWMSLLQGLLGLCRDKRQEARDGAIQILWRSIELYGGTLDEAAWNQCLWDVIVPLLEALNEDIRAVEQDTEAAKGEETFTGIPLLYKQWDDSKILALGSVGSVFSSELPRAIADLDSFERVCQQIIDYCRQSILNNRAGVAAAAAKALEKFASATWDGNKKDKAEYLALSIWNAWTDIGQVLPELVRADLTQQTLEAYSKIMTALQAGTYLEFSHDRCRDLLAILKTVVTYSHSPDYRPDQDVMPPLQSTVMAIIDKAWHLSAPIASDVISDLADYMTLAYTATTAQAMSPSLPQQGQKRSQAVTYIALSKHSDNKMLEIYQHYRLDPAIYRTAVEKLLAAYSIPLKLKYDCPSPSRFGDDPPLWKTATIHFLQVAKSTVEAIDPVGAEIGSETVARLWKRLVGAFEAILSADCRSVLEMSPDDQRMEEDFDLAVILTIEMHILPKIGDARVPTETIVALAQALRQATRLYELGYDDLADGPASPSLTVISNEHSRNKDIRFSDSYDAQASSATLIDGTTVEDVALPRERFAFWSFDLLFTMCQHSDAVDRQRQALLAFPSLFHRCLAVLRVYLADLSVRGRVPFTRVREEELAFVLSRLGRLRLNEGLFEAAFDSEDPFRALTEIQEGHRALTATATASELLKLASRRSSRAHLHAVYGHLLNLLSSERLQAERTTVTASYASLAFPGGEAGAGADKQREWPQGSTFDLARKCLELVGDDFSM